MQSQELPGALDGIRVIDLSTVLMGPLACRMLGDHGADVIQVVPPNTEPTIVGDGSGMGGIALDLHRNKRSVHLDLKSDQGQTALWDLIGSADVLVTNMRAAALDRLGISADAVRTRYPSLVYCLANGYGAQGPYAQRAAYDDAIQALSGFAALSEEISGTPAYAPSVIVDKTCALVVVQAVMAALLHRANTGQGQTINVPMFESMVALNLVEHYRGAAMIPPRGEIGYSRLLNPNRRPYKCADGWVAILPYTDRNWRDFLGSLGREDILEEQRFSTHSARMANVAELYAIVAEVAPSKTCEEWVQFCDTHSIPCNPVLRLEEVVRDPHIATVGLLQETEHPIEGRYVTVRDPVTYEGMSSGLRRHAPVPGAHTREVFQALGWDDEALDTLIGER